ncbi:MAG: PD40 domain-containing protein [Clostridium sp.]|nr:PD40 domain-containing protein [Clostridium sp.]
MSAGKPNLLGKMSARKKFAVLLGGCSLAAAVVIAGVILLPKQEKAAEASSWVLLSGENHRIVNEGEPLIFTGLQESDYRKIRSGVLEKERDVGDGRAVRRPADFSDLKFYEVSSDNSLKPANPSRFSITIKDDGIQHALQLASFKVNGKTVLSPADPDFMETSYQLVSSPDGKRHILWTDGGMWLLEEGTLDEARKISSELHNNKTRRQLEVEVTELIQAQGIDTGWEVIVWNNDPRFSPDGTKIVYTTNRDFETRNSWSVWVYDLETNTERRLLGGGRYDYGAAGWLNDGRLLVGKSDGENIFAGSTHYLVDLQGENQQHREIPLSSI